MSACAKRPTCSTKLIHPPREDDGALDRTLNVERLRLACGSTQLSSRDGWKPPLISKGGAPPRIWTFLSRLRRFPVLPGARTPPGGIPPPGSATSWGGPYGVYFSLALPRGLAIIPSALWEAPGGESHTHSREERQNGEEEVGVWRLLDQLQGLQGHHGIRDGLVAHRPLRDDEEDLGQREAEETRQEVVPPRARSGAS